MKTPVMPLVMGERLPIEEAMAELRRGIAPHPLVREVDAYSNASRYVFRHRDVKLLAILEAESHDDGRLWAHLSLSAQTPRRLPNWEEVRWAKGHFLGDRRAIMVLPPRAEYINITPNVFNLYVCLSGEVLPDFRHRDPISGDIGI